MPKPIVSTSATGSVAGSGGISDSEQHFFAANGYLHLQRLLHASVPGGVAAEAMHLVIRHNGTGRPQTEATNPMRETLQIRNAWQLSDPLRQIVCSLRLARLAAALLGASGVQLYADVVVIKEPTGAESAWHTDSSHVPVAGEAFIAAYIPLQPSGPRRAGLGFRAASHHLPLARTFKPTSRAQLRRVEQRLNSAEAPIVELTCDAGDIAFYSGLTFHRLCANESKTPLASLWVYYIREGQTMMRPRNAFQATERDRHFAEVPVGRPIVTTLNPRLWCR